MFTMSLLRRGEPSVKTDYVCVKDQNTTNNQQLQETVLILCFGLDIHISHYVTERIPSYW